MRHAIRPSSRVIGSVTIESAQRPALIVSVGVGARAPRSKFPADSRDPLTDSTSRCRG
jgi:hypothetical protein